jgi:hypothetical protein
MLFFKSSHRSTVPAHQGHATNDHHNLIEEEGVTFQDDCYLEEIARAANAEADTATPASRTPAKKDERLSAFETELLAAWSDH